MLHQASSPAEWTLRESLRKACGRMHYQTVQLVSDWCLLHPDGHPPQTCPEATVFAKGANV